MAAHDFFTPQPVKNASVFLLKQILHDWSDAYCIKILNQLRAAATSSTKLLIIDSIVPYACHDPNLDSEDVIPGAAPHEAPPPLLSNYGQVNDIQYHSDLAVSLISEPLCRLSSGTHVETARCFLRIIHKSVRLVISGSFWKRVGGALSKFIDRMPLFTCRQRLFLFDEIGKDFRVFVQ
jgi:hypothetical protein